jgi:hypothetical protein
VACERRQFTDPCGNVHGRIWKTVEVCGNVIQVFREQVFRELSQMLNDELRPRMACQHTVLFGLMTSELCYAPLDKGFAAVVAVSTEN